MNENRPIILEIEEAKNEIVQCINGVIQTHQLPCYFLEPILKEVYGQIKAAAQSELEATRAQLKENEKGAE